jgi:hypothetical protein
MKKISLTTVLCLLVYMCCAQNRKIKIFKRDLNKDSLISIKSLIQMNQGEDFEAAIEDKNEIIAPNFTLIKNKLKQRLATGMNNTSFLSSLSSIALTSNSDGTSLTANINLAYANGQYSFSINAPLSKKRVDVLSLDGLAQKTNVSLGWQHDFWKGRELDYNDTVLTATLNKIWKERKITCCNEAPKMIDKYEDLTEDEKTRFQQLFKFKIMLPFFGISGKLARNDFEYFRDTTFISTASDEKYDFEIKVYGGLRMTNHKSIAISLLYQQYFDAGELNTYNLPIKNGVEQHRELYEGAPQLSKKLNILLEYRSINKNATLAINPYILADLQNKRIEARAQFCFFRKKNDEGIFQGLNGGAFIGYRTSADYKFESNKGNFLIGLFIAPAFDLNKY